MLVLCYRRTAASLPLPKDETGARPRIDLVVFMLDLTSRMSLEQLKAAIVQIDIEYLLGRSCIVATHVDLQHLASVEVYELDNLLLTYEIPFLLVNQLVWW